MPTRHLLVALALLLATWARAQVPSLDDLPRPSTPPPERGPVVPAQVERWRNEAKALEFGDGVERDPVRAAELYCRAARFGDAEAQYSLGWMLTNARGVQRDEAQAAHLFAAAAEQGMSQAQNILARMGTPQGPPPACLRQPEEDRTPPPPPPRRGRHARAAPGPAGLRHLGHAPRPRPARGSRARLTRRQRAFHAGRISTSWLDGGVTLGSKGWVDCPPAAARIFSTYSRVSAYGGTPR
jgi:Sel1 repeat